MSKNIDYTDKVRKHFLKPKFMGEMKNPSSVALVINPYCGDSMKVYLKIGKTEKNKDEIIKDARFQTLGCCAAIASSDVACKLIKGKTLKSAKKITKKDILHELGGLPPVKVHCSLLGQDAIRKAIKNYEVKNAQ
jgi:NifU-like protein involved in Fe-S cluster formation